MVPRNTITTVPTTIHTNNTITNNTRYLYHYHHRHHYDFLQAFAERNITCLKNSAVTSSDHLL